MPKITKISKKDLKRVSRFEKAEWHKLDQKHYGKPIVSYMDKDFHLMAKDSEGIIGIIKGKFELGVVYVSSLIVAEKRRGQGVGKALLARVERSGKKVGLPQSLLIYRQ